MNLKRLKETLNHINTFGYSDRGVNRLAYSKAEREAVSAFIELCEKEELEVRIDPCGNVIARRNGRYSDLPAVACGSHLDSVINGGKFDGAIGVVAALEMIRSLNEKGIETDHPIEIICFAAEESSRFGVATIGSKAMSGVLNKEEIHQLVDKRGISIQEAFAQQGLNFDDIEKSARNKDELKVFLEMHIEQGPILETEMKQIGIATGIAAPTRYDIRIQGKASHSGTTPMNYRRDALLGASEIALEIERAALVESSNGTVATVGVCEVKPGAINVVSDSVVMKVDIRGTSVTSKSHVIHLLKQKIYNVEKQRKLQINLIELCNESPVDLDQGIIHSLVESCRKNNISYIQMASGAGHDAMNMVHLCPTGLFFVQSHDGLSHHKDEYTAIEQIGVGAFLLEKEVIKLAQLSNEVRVTNLNRMENV